MSRTRKIAKESPSKKLRNIFFVLWEQDNEAFIEFDTYYESKLYKLINHYKQLINK